MIVDHTFDVPHRRPGQFREAHQEVSRAHPPTTALDGSPTRLYRSGMPIHDWHARHPMRMK